MAARVAIDHAASAAESPRERAWVAVLTAALARAAGEPFADAADEALDRARDSGDPELCREALPHLLLLQTFRMPCPRCAFDRTWG